LAKAGGGLCAVIMALLIVPSTVLAANQTKIPTTTTGIATSVATHSAVLNATVNPNGLTTTYAFQYGTTTNYGSQTSTRTVGSGWTPVSVQVTVNNLASGTTYHFRVVSTNPLGTSAGADAPFVTVAELPAVTLGMPSLVSDSAMTLTGTINPQGRATTYSFQYGGTSGYGLQSAPVALGSGTSTKTVSAVLPGLAQGTAYHYRLVATSSAGTSVTGDAVAVTTGNALPATGPAPTVSLAAAVNITSTSVQLNGAINPQGDPTAWHFEYGLTSDYGLETTPVAMPGLGIRPINAQISGLRSATTYHYRLVAESANGLYVGPGLTFTTKKTPAAPLRDLTLKATARHDRWGVRVTVSGQLVMPAGVGSEGAAGPVTIRFTRETPSGPTFMLTRTEINSDGSYRLIAWFSNGHLHGRNQFGVTVRFGGNPALQPSIKRISVHL
jgi:hypothetical protein